MRKFKDLFFTPKKGLMTFVVLMLALAFLAMSAGCAAQAVMQNQAPEQGQAENPAAADAAAAAASPAAAAPQVEIAALAPAAAMLEAPQNNAAAAFPASSANVISAEQAKEIALQHAALTAADVTFIRVELDRDDGVTVYDVEFYRGNMEYDYEIDAATGGIRSYDYDVENHMPAAQPSNSAAASPASSASFISAEQAKEIALQHAALAAADVTFIRAELDRDDGVTVYDVEFYRDNMEYDYEIDAATGGIRSYDYDVERYTPQAPAQVPAQAPAQVPAQAPAQPSGSAAYIGVDKAKSIALAHAGLSPSEVVFKKAKLENDDGRTEYEIEFFMGMVEYEYTIDAINGSIYEYDAEYDD